MKVNLDAQTALVAANWIAARDDSCASCKRPRNDFPMAFRTDPYCSDNCRKKLRLDGIR